VRRPHNFPKAALVDLIELLILEQVRPSRPLGPRAQLAVLN